MPLVSADLKTAMLDATAGALDPIALGTSIADYIVANAVLNFAWVAMDSSSVPDPVTTATGEIISCTIVFAQTGSNENGASMTLLGNWIMAGLTAAQYNITAAGFACTPVSLAGPVAPPDLTPPTIPEGGDVRDLLFTNMATKIITWLMAYVPPAPVSGTRGSFTGVGTCTAIT